MKNLVYLTLLLALFLGACASAQATDLSSKSLPESSAQPTSLPSDAEIEYTRSGGLIGKSETWLIYANGQVSGPGGTKGNIEPVIVSQLVSDFDAIGVSNFPPAGSEENYTCNDCYTYQVTIRSNGEVRTFTAKDAQPDVPESFWTALKNLQLVFLPQAK
jgi:hypothetical protein